MAKHPELLDAIEEIYKAQVPLKNRVIEIWQDTIPDINYSSVLAECRQWANHGPQPLSQIIYATFLRNKGAFPAFLPPPAKSSLKISHLPVRQTVAIYKV